MWRTPFSVVFFFFKGTAFNVGFKAKIKVTFFEGTLFSVGFKAKPKGNVFF